MTPLRSQAEFEIVGAEEGSEAEAAEKREYEVLAVANGGSRRRAHGPVDAINGKYNRENERDQDNQPGQMTPLVLYPSLKAGIGFHR